ncbi:hypothetical protein OEA41_010416 [Lepraria neglecta]|uniref:Uncharacterized protein n=1 Tax=Lepraria neglecta TaxID=209136 RepID=A0AAE0DFA5_9LECA|nr:hypothetical protein OEA41_010416 [Lepraria neglecta]
MAPSPRTRRLSRRSRPLSVDFNIYEDQPAPTIARNIEILNTDIAMYQYTPAPKPPRGTKPPATNLANPSDPPNPQTNTKTYSIVWIYSKPLGIYSSMEDAEAEGDREKKFVVITGLKEFGDANEMDSDNAHPNPKRQRLSAQGVAQPSNPPQPSYSVTVKLQYGRYWVEYTCTYSPSTTTFANLQPTEISAASAASLEAQKKTNKDMYE